MKIRVVVPTYRRPAKLMACLESLAAQTYPDVEVESVEDLRGEFAIGIWNRHARAVTTGAFVYVCDDVELDPDCLEVAARSLLSRWPDTDGVVCFRQRNIHQAKAAMGMIGARFLDRFPDRTPFCPDYSRFHFDSELGLVARRLGRFRYERAATLVHHHPQHTSTPEDDAHRRVRESSAVARDNRVWRERRARGWLWGMDSNRLEVAA